MRDVGFTALVEGINVQKTKLNLNKSDFVTAMAAVSVCPKTLQVV